MAERRVPRIRFKGFEEDWEQRKLEKFAAETRGGGTPTTSNRTYWNGDIPWIQSSDLKEDELFEVKPRKYVSNIGLSRSATQLVEAKSIAVVTRVGVGKLALMPNSYTTSQDFVSLSRLQVAPYFAVYSIYHMLQEELQVVQGTSIKGMTKEDLLSKSLLIPVDIGEQTRLGCLFYKFDSLLSLHQRKLEKLKILKKAMLEKMFPKNGAKVPEIRFSGFTEDWEQRKLEEYLVVSVEKNLGGVYGKADVLSVSGDYGIVNQIEFQGRSFAGASVLQYGVVHTGDVVYTKSPLSSNPYGIIKTNRGAAGIVSTLYAVYRPLSNITSEFVQLYFEQNARMNNYMHPLVNKGAKNDMKVSASNALKGVVKFPSKSEQKNICRYFDSIDSVITLHQRKPF